MKKFEELKAIIHKKAEKHDKTKSAASETHSDSDNSDSKNSFSDTTITRLVSRLTTTRKQLEKLSESELSETDKAKIHPELIEIKNLIDEILS
jgi:hypothetical protein